MTVAAKVVDGPVDTRDVAAWEASRREALRRGLGLGGTVVAITAIPALLAARTAFAQAEGDAGILRSAIVLELGSVLAYDRVVADGVLPGDLRRAVERFREHEREHAGALTAALREMGGQPPTLAARDADRVEQGLAGATSVASVVSFLVELESAAVAAYHEAQRRLDDARLLRTGASIMANEGQHLVVLRRALGRAPVPNAFETGRS